MISSKIKLLVIILVLLLTALIFGVLYSSKKTEKAKNINDNTLKESSSSEVENIPEEKIIESLTAPADSENNTTPVTQEVLDSVSAPVPGSQDESASNEAETVPVPDDILRSLTAPAN